MPNQDRLHPIVRRALEKDGWTIVREQVTLTVAAPQQVTRRLYVDLKAQSATGTIVLIEVKGVGSSPVHELMELIGQYLVYRAVLDSLEDETPLYVAVPDQIYKDIVQHPLGQIVMQGQLKRPIPFVVYDPEQEEIIQWIPPL